LAVYEGAVSGVGKVLKCQSIRKCVVNTVIGIGKQVGIRELKDHRVMKCTLISFVFGLSVL
jgi:hypothetical protein